jgi:hypothetical protein
VFPVRYELNLCILFGRNLVFKGFIRNFLVSVYACHFCVTFVLAHVHAFPMMGDSAFPVRLYCVKQERSIAE